MRAASARISLATCSQVRVAWWVAAAAIFMPSTATKATAGRPQGALRVSREWDTRAMAITGIHAVMYTRDAEADRAWLADVLGLESVDAGGGWLIFALPPAELAAHPASSEDGDVALYLMCDDIETTVQELSEKGVAFDGP